MALVFHGTGPVRVATKQLLQMLSPATKPSSMFEVSVQETIVQQIAGCILGSLVELPT